MSARQGGTETVSDGGEEEERNEGNVQGLKTTKEKEKRRRQEVDKRNKILF